MLISGQKDIFVAKMRMHNVPQGLFQSPPLDGWRVASVSLPRKEQICSSTLESARVWKLHPQHKQFSTAAGNQADDMDYFIILL